ncbi:MAG: winged helix-turn-helix domain-containing protein [Bdellovibrionales bacterium]|nr:winged helix-turn-helix domain-containing protein [Bdellovibrionales bacterium]
MKKNLKMPCARCRIKRGGSIGASEIRALLADQFDCCYSQSGTYALLDRLNLVWITGRSRHPKIPLKQLSCTKNCFPLKLKILNHLLILIKLRFGGKMRVVLVSKDL